MLDICLVLNLRNKLSSCLTSMQKRLHALYLPGWMGASLARDNLSWQDVTCLGRMVMQSWQEGTYTCRKQLHAVGNKAPWLSRVFLVPAWFESLVFGRKESSHGQIQVVLGQLRQGGQIPQSLARCLVVGPNESCFYRVYSD